jgi:hypothetical protein
MGAISTEEAYTLIMKLRAAGAKSVYLSGESFTNISVEFFKPENEPPTRPVTELPEEEKERMKFWSAD